MRKYYSKSGKRMVFRKRPLTTRQTTQVKRIVRSQSELKAYAESIGTAFGANSIDATFTERSLTGLIIQATAAGSPNTARNGDAIRLKNLHFEALMNGNTTGNGQSVGYRIVVLYLNPGDSISALSIGSSLLGPTSDLENPKVLYDKVFVVHNQITGVAGKRWHKFNIPLRGKEIRYQGGGADTERNRELVLGIAGDNGSNKAGFGGGFWRLTFTDS